MIETIRIKGHTIRCTASAVVLVLLFSFCTRIELTDRARITLVTDWTERTAGVSVPERYTVEIAHQKLNFQLVQGELPSLDPGNYPVLIYNHAPHLSVSGTTISVAQRNGMPEPLPGWLFTAAMDVTYQNDQVEVITAKMQQQVRQLEITLQPTGGSAASISSISGVLTGVAAQWDFAKHIPVGAASSVPMDLVKQTDGSWKATIRLLGLGAAKQEIIGQVTFEGNDPSAINFNTDLTTDLAGFQTEKHRPLRLRAEMETPTEAGFNVTITDWKQENTSGEAW